MIFKGKGGIDVKVNFMKKLSKVSLGTAIKKEHILKGKMLKIC